MRKGWETKKLKEVANYFIGLTYSPKDVSEKGTIVLRSSNIQNDKLDLSDTVRVNKTIKENLKVKDGDILMCSRNGSKRLVGKTATIQGLKEEMTFGTFMTVVRSQFNPFLSWFFISDEFRKQIGVGENTMINQITKYMLDDIEVPIPPLPEQQLIVSLLDEAFAAIAKAKANTEKNLQNAKDLFESYLQSVFANPGDDWVEKPLQDIVDARCTLSYGIVQPGEEFPNGLPVIRPTDLTTKFIGLVGLKLIDPQLAGGYKRTTLIGDELLLCVRGNTGVISIATKELKGANVTRGIVPIRINPEVLSMEFGYYEFISEFINNQIKGKTYGAALMQINIGDLRKVTMLVPPLPLQNTLVKKLDSLSSETKKLETIYHRKLNDLEELKKSILQKAFSGDLKTLEKELA